MLYLWLLAQIMAVFHVYYIRPELAKHLETKSFRCEMSSKVIIFFHARPLDLHPMRGDNSGLDVQVKRCLSTRWQLVFQLEAPAWVLMSTKGLKTVHAGHSSSSIWNFLRNSTCDKKAMYKPRLPINRSSSFSSSESRTNAQLNPVRVFIRENHHVNPYNVKVKLASAAQRRYRLILSHWISIVVKE